MTARRRRAKAEGRPDLHDLGLPQYSALTIEGRIERAGMVADHLIRADRGLEKPVWQSDWRFGLQLILITLVLVVASTLIAFYA